MALASPPIGGWVFTIEKEWSCAEHDYPEHGCECCGEGGCEECETSRWEIVYDTDGWATMTFRPRTALDGLTDMMFASLKEEINRPSVLLGALKRDLSGVKIDWIDE